MTCIINRDVAYVEPPRKAVTWLLSIVLLTSAGVFARNPSAERFDQFGSALARGDFNADGFEDLAIGVPGEDINGPNFPDPTDPIERQSLTSSVGAVDVIYGTASGLRATNRQFWQPGLNNLQGGPLEQEAFGYALAAGDFNRDGFTDLAIGAPGNSTGGAHAGAVYVLYGSVTGLRARTAVRQIWRQGIPALGELPEVNDRFGAALAAGDFDYDGYDDLAVGVPGENPLGRQWAGAVNLIYGSASGLSETATSRRTSFWHQTLCTMRQCPDAIGDGPEYNDNFGWSLAVGDFNGDRIDDLAIGVPGESLTTVGQAGAVNVLYGTASGLTTKGNQFWHQNHDGMEDQAEPGDKFGSSLAAGDFNGDRRTDLAIGVPKERFVVSGVNILDAGAVSVIYGSSTGLTVTGNQFWYQGRDGVQDQPESFDNFGYSLAAGDFNADGADDLAIGVPVEDLGDAGEIWDTGAVNVLYGSRVGAPVGLITRGNQFWHQGVPNVEGTPELADRFGFCLAAGRFNGRPYSSLAIGIPWQSVFSVPVGSIPQAGAVGVIYGSNLVTGLNATTPVPDQGWTQIVISGNLP